MLAPVLVALGLTVVPAAVVPATAATPGGIFITGHDPDFHAHLGGNTTGARNLLQRAVEFVTFGHPSPSMLLVTSRITPPAGHIDSQFGLLAAGFTFDMASAGGVGGTLDLASVNFNAYDVVVVASDFGGILTQAELDILNARTPDVHDFVNAGGGLVVLAQSNSGARLTPGGKHFDFLPFLVSELQLNQNEVDYTVTPFGATLGLTDADVNGNASHNVFTATGGLNVVNFDAAGRIMSLAARGAQLCPDGVPAASVSDVTVTEGPAGTTTAATFTVWLSAAPCRGPATVDVATVDGTGVGGEDFTTLAPSPLTFAVGETSKSVTVSVHGDDVFELDEDFRVVLSSPAGVTIADGEATGTILNDDPENRPPDCSAVRAGPDQLWPPNRSMRPVTLAGANDPDGDAVTIAVTGAVQDEPTASGPGDPSPDAALTASPDTVQLRAERLGTGDGRIYWVAFAADDGRGGTCTGVARVSVPHAPVAPAVDSGGGFDSFS